MRLRFTKMHGPRQRFRRARRDARADRAHASAATLHRRPPFRHRVRPDPAGRAARASTDTDFYYRIFNADGGEVEQCGNGARCFVRYVHDRGLTDEIGDSRRHCERRDRPAPAKPTARVSVDMGVPRFDPAASTVCRAESRSLRVTRSTSAGEPVEVSVLSMGNPHAVQVVRRRRQRAGRGRRARSSKPTRAFPQRVNAGYMQIVDRQPHTAARVRARRGRDARLRHGRVRGRR